MAMMLMATWDGAGNFPPERALVRLLVERGHKVSVLGHDHQRVEVEADGATFIAYAGIDQIKATDPNADTTVFEKVVFAEGIGASLTAEIGRTKPDLLLIDAILSTALSAAQSSGVPAVALGSTLHTFLQSAPMGAQAEALDLVMTFTDRAFELGADLPSNVVHVGPLRPRESGVGPWTRRRLRRPLVVVSLSTSYQAQAKLLQRLCDALGGLDIEALVTTGGAVDPANLTAAANTSVVRFVPHEAVLPQAELLITHAGHGTVIAGATFGVPLLCLPMGRDQPTVAQSVVALGLGLVLDPEAGVTEIRSAIGDILADAAMKDRARAYADQAAIERRDQRAVDLIEGLLHGG
jgi:UDP:flavonoid glycosyltransferase YjiC (YdhE family)